MGLVGECERELENKDVKEPFVLPQQVVGGLHSSGRHNCEEKPSRASSPPPLRPLPLRLGPGRPAPITLTCLSCKTKCATHA